MGLSKKVAIVGAGMSKFGMFYPEKQNRDLWQDAFINAMESVDNGIDMNDVGELLMGNFTADLFNHESHQAPLMAQICGLNPKPATRFESACASSGIAMKYGVLNIASGLNDVVCVGGIECMSEVPTVDVTDALATAADTRLEYPAGATFPGLYAAIATAHMHKYGTKDEDLFNVAIKNYANGAENPYAQVQQPIEKIIEGKLASMKKRNPDRDPPDWSNPYDFLRSSSNPYIAYPLRLFDCSLITDGACCLFLASEEVARKYTDTPIWISGFGQGSASLTLADREEYTSFIATKTAAEKAYKMSGKSPKDIQIAEVHDCFTIAEIVALEDCGFYDPGKAVDAIREGETKRDGVRPINTSGGLKSKGHPVGATGTGHAVEVFKQMRGQAERNRQVKTDIECALSHNLGGSGATCVVQVYEK